MQACWFFFETEGSSKKTLTGTVNLTSFALSWLVSKPHPVQGMHPCCYMASGWWDQTASLQRPCTPCMRMMQIIMHCCSRNVPGCEMTAVFWRPIKILTLMNHTWTRDLDHTATKTVDQLEALLSQSNCNCCSCLMLLFAATQ